MRPEVSRLVKQIYPPLEDGQNVLGRPNIRGLNNQSVFFMDHNFKEQELLD